ncbi:MAG: DinB family protein [Balneolaceae bacterium]|nr:DinB family protein [Balneolaceae bacterium]
MKKHSVTAVSAALILLITATPSLLFAQDAGDPFRQQFNRHFEYASRVLSLAEAMPAGTYSWRPMEEVSSVGEVYTHIARYNYYYLDSSLGIPAPEGVDVESIESITGKEKIVDILRRSFDHVRRAVENMPDSAFREEAELYGRTVNGQAVLLQLLTHLSEHVGQSIAYARTNEVVPPWSR